MSRVLIVDDEPNIAWALKEALGDEGFEVSATASAEEAWGLIDQSEPDLVLLDVRLPGVDGLTTMERLRQEHRDLPVIVMTAFGSLETAVRAVRNGAYDYLTKPFDLDVMLSLVHRAINSRSSSGAASARLDDGAASDSQESVLLGKSPQMQEIFRKIALLAAHDVPVLITGESGTGKEVVAKAIHQHSLRQDGPFVPVCVPALPANLVESELFGHVKGAFTGATAQRQGLLSQAHRGTAFFDEIGDIELSLQVKLLRILESHQVQPVGSAQSVPSDFRLLAATNRNLSEMVRDDQFREDLFYRLNVFHLHIAPLRDRRDDVLPLAEHFLSQQKRTDALTFSEATRAELESRRWYGNVRELKHAVQYAAVMCRSGNIEPSDLPEPLSPNQTAGQGGHSIEAAVSDWMEKTFQRATEEGSPSGVYQAFLEVVEPVLFEETLKRTNGNRKEASQILGVHRQTLREKMRRYGMEGDAE